MQAMQDRPAALGGAGPPGERQQVGAAGLRAQLGAPPERLAAQVWLGRPAAVALREVTTRPAGRGAAALPVAAARVSAGRLAIASVARVAA